VTVFCDQCGGMMEVVGDATAGTSWGARGPLNGIYECSTLGCGRHFHPRAGYLSSGFPPVREPRCSKDHVAAVTSINPDTDERKFGCVVCNIVGISKPSLAVSS